MSMASLRMNPHDIVNGLTTLDDYAVNAEQVTKLLLVIPDDETIKVLEQNRSIATELTKEEQFLLHILTVPGIKSHLECLEIKFNFTDRFLVLNKSL